MLRRFLYRLLVWVLALCVTALVFEPISEAGSLIQDCGVTSTTSCSATTLALNSCTVTAGHTLVTLCSLSYPNGGAAAISSISDNQSDSWSSLTSCTSNPGGEGACYVFEAHSLSITGGATVVTAHLPGGGSGNCFVTCDLLEFPNLNSSTVDVSHCSTQNLQTTITAGPVTPVHSPDLLLAMMCNLQNQSPSTGPTNSFNALTNSLNANTPCSNYPAYFDDSATSSISTAWTVASSTNYQGLLVGLKANAATQTATATPTFTPTQTATATFTATPTATATATATATPIASRHCPPLQNCF